MWSRMACCRNEAPTAHSDSAGCGADSARGERRHDKSLPPALPARRLGPGGSKAPPSAVASAVTCTFGLEPKLIGEQYAAPCDLRDSKIDEHDAAREDRHAQRL